MSTNPTSVHCPNCQAKPGQPCTQPTDTGRKACDVVSHGAGFDRTRRRGAGRTVSIEYNSQSFQQGYWVGRGELRDEDVTATQDESYREGVLTGCAEQWVVFVDGVAVGDYTPTFHGLADLEAGNVERVPDDD